MTSIRRAPPPRSEVFEAQVAYWRGIASATAGDAIAFELHQRKHLEDELVKLVRRELRKTVRALSGKALESVIHESRKSVKKVRGRGIP